MMEKQIDHVKEARKLRLKLQSLSDDVLLYLHAVDSLLSSDKTVPSAAGAKLAKQVNWLEVKNDSIRFETLGVNFRTDDKTKCIKKLRAKITASEVKNVS